jgi:Abnormal spindle-like microcephaly-assoc'd, ASPM-SPD-2-Hydin
LGLSTGSEFLSIIGCVGSMSRSRVFAATLALAVTLLLAGCAGVSSGPQTQTSENPAGTLAVSPSTLSFGNVAVGSSSSLTGTLSATTADVVVSSAAWNGSGYSVTGITFPVTVAAGKSANYTVTFTPPAAGASAGSISFVSDASDASLKQSFSGDGTQESSGQHSVALSWDPSTSTVAGYNLYRGTQSGGPYSKLNSSLLSGTTYTDSGVQPGATYYYVSTAVTSSNVESAYSNQATAVIP